MANVTVPFNIGLLQLNESSLNRVRKVSSLDIFEPSKENFHPDGLWSTITFGNIGDERRNVSFGYIDVKLPVIHPLVYKQLISARGLYKEIMASETYAEWSDTEKDFIKSNPIDGDTGYHFFIKHLSKLQLKDTNTTKRSQLIKLMDTYRLQLLNRYIIVLPAGMRDVETNEGRITVDDINKMYRRLITLSNNISDTTASSYPEMADPVRYSIQVAFVELYEYLDSLINGKKKLILSKFASRRIFNGTRNVITAASPGGRYMGDKRYMRHCNSAVGLFQFMKSILPVAKKRILEGYLSTIFKGVDSDVMLIDPDTLQSEPCYIDPDYFGLYQTNEGVEKLIELFRNESIRHRPLTIYVPQKKKNMYLGLCYRGHDGTFKIFNDIRSLPENRSKNDVTPMTFGELMYSELFDIANDKYPFVIVRYPIAGTGSSPVSLPFTKTTITQDIRYQLNDDWEKDENMLATSFPVLGDTWFNSLAPALSLLAGLAADFDGDTMSANTVYSNEAIEELLKHMSSYRPYVGSDGKLTRSQEVDTVKFVTHNLSDVSSLANIDVSKFVNPSYNQIRV